MDQTNQKITPPAKKKNTLALIVGFVVVLFVVLGIYIFVSKDNKKTTHDVTNNQTGADVTAQKTAELSTDPQSAVTQNGEVVTFSIWVDTGGQKVSAVQANLSYPADKFDFISIDDTGSAFEIRPESKGGDGKITIARGQIGGVTGKQLVAKVNLKAKTVDGEGSVTFSDQSKVLTLADNPQDILNTTSGAKLTVGE